MILQQNIIFEKNQFFNAFISFWHQEFKNLKAILRYFHTYDEQLSHSVNGQFLDENELDESQLDWLWLLSKLENPIENTFFKPNWVPVNRNEYDLFVDLSSPTFELFRAEYFCFEPYQWFKYPVIRNIPDLMISMDDFGSFLELEKEHSEITRKDILEKLFEYCYQSGYAKRPDVFDPEEEL